MESQDSDSSDEKPCYAPTTNFPPTRAGSGQSNSNPFGTIHRSVVSPRVVESGLRSPATPKSNFLSSNGGGVVLRPSLLRAGGKDAKEVSESNGNGSELSSVSGTADTEESSSDGLSTANDPTLSLEESCAESSPNGSASTNAVGTAEVEERKSATVGTANEEKKAVSKSADLEPEDSGKPFSEVLMDKAENRNPNGESVPVPTFIFGSNLGDRVENAVSFGQAPAIASSASDLTFASAAAGPGNEIGTESDWKNYGEERIVKRKWEDVAPTTGEEEESNVLQTTCRLFTFDTTTSSWVERGRGLLRLNDRQTGTLTSRLIVRTQGSLRLMLNTPVFHGMMTTKASEKSLKITALDEDGELKVYLIQCSPSDAETLHSALEWRVRSLAPSPPSAEKVTIHSSHFQTSSTKKKKSE